MKRICKNSCLLLIALFISLLFSSCGPKISGKIYLDTNSNNDLDVSDRAMGGTMYEITIDGMPFKSGVTENDGTFMVTAGKTGYYCVKAVQSSAVSKSSNLGQKAATSDAIALKAAKDPDEVNLDVDGDGVRNAIDNCPKIANANQDDEDRDAIGDACEDEDDDEVNVDIDDDGIRNIADNCPTIANTNQLDEDENDIGDACEDDDDNDNKASTKKITRPPTFGDMKSCSEVNLANVQLNVKVPFSIEAAIGRIPEPSEIEVEAGETFELEFIYPSTCTFEPLNLPEELQSGTSWDESFAGSISQVDINRLGKRPVYLDTNVSDITQDKLVSRKIDLVASPLIIYDTDIPIIANVLCPNNEEVLLPRTIKIKGEFPFEVRPNLETEISELVDGPDCNVTIEFRIKNVSNITYRNIDFYASVPEMMVSSVQLVGSDSVCDSLGEEGVCTFSLSRQETKTLIFVFGGVINVNAASKQFVVNSKIVYAGENGFEKNFPEIIKFSIYPHQL